MPARSASRPCPGRRQGRRTLRLLTRGLLGAAALYLVYFHLELLAERLADRTLLRPLVAAQWAGAAGLLLTLWHLRRARAPLLHGRRALAFWILVLLLHAVPAVPGGEESLRLDGEALLLVLPAVVAVLAAAALLRAAGQAAAVPAPIVLRRRWRAAPVVAAPPRAARRLAARPPPA